MRALSSTFLRLAAGLAFVIPTIGCTPAGLLNAVVTDNGYQTIRDVAYAEGPRHRLDIYIPEMIAADRSVAVFFYGGRWEYGSKADYLFVGQALASRGIITVIADYRLYPDIRFPAFVEDGAKAVTWVKRHIADHGGDADRTFLIGHSAGAHLAAMLSLDTAFLAAEGLKIDSLRGFIGLAGPYDFLPIKDPVVKEVFKVDDLQATQPINHVHADAPKALLLTGDDDETVLPRNSWRLRKELNAQGGDAEVEVYEGVGHVGVVLSLASPFRWLAPALDDIVSFIQQG